MPWTTEKLFTDKWLQRLETQHRILFIFMICCCDEQGRIEGDAEQLAARAFPRHDPAKTVAIIESGLNLLAKEKKILRYVGQLHGSKRKVIKIPDYLRYRNARENDSRSRDQPRALSAVDYAILKLVLDKQVFKGLGQLASALQAHNPAYVRRRLEYLQSLGLIKMTFPVTFPGRGNCITIRKGGRSAK